MPEPSLFWARLARRSLAKSPSFLLSTREAGGALHLYRIAHESISNAVRHGEASEVHILLPPGDGSTTMLIRDNGRGMSRLPTRPDGMGLRTMRYRAGAVGATLEIRVGVDGGTEIAYTFPSKS